MSGRPKPAEIPTRTTDVTSREWVNFFRDLMSRKPQYDELHVVAAGIVYFGDESTDGSWRILRDGNNLLHQRRESGSWVTKHTITP